MQPEETDKNKEKPEKQPFNQENLDMHSSKDAQESQGGKGGRSTDTDTNSMHDRGNEHSIAGREDS
ncbi:hypothetical protein [Adhaeribacter terreus]|uniref:Uncharacterized protein n=1 Tax=Adhaeribacter terreus TaxID=529703 RepID=A0ABW0EAL8_9BACT